MPRPARRRVAVVGTGAIVSGSHLSALRVHAERAELVAAVDVDQGRLDAFRELAGGEVAGYTSVAEMLDAARPDLVLIGTPPSLHREQTVAALKAGAWVLCEKPLTLSLAEYDEIAAAEEASGAYASVVFQHRYGSGAVHARELITSGELGAPGSRTARPPGTGTPPTTPYRGAERGPVRAAAPPWATASTSTTCCCTCSAPGRRSARWRPGWCTTPRARTSPRPSSGSRTVPSPPSSTVCCHPTR